ncbi:non-ribosomal peptide synthetase [Caldalkalibacillus mannanilyticus]|uniref:non-ribosomal peptide synthetase n=1 Tax=Caldalkalibacillus mannanilyticus TaxID=1418 RepID=UPI000469A395
MARWLPNGSIEYIGRVDDQVKIRGYRIELGEVEAQLLKQENIKEGIVLARQDQVGHKLLCAYYVADQALSSHELRKSLAEKLPSYMLPSYFVQLAQFPLTVNGKIDRKALPAPEEGVQSGAEYVAPRNEMEAQLVQLWHEVLGIERIGIKDNFFDLGGHSLRATTLVAKIHREMDIALPLRAVFQAPTLEMMAEELFKLEKNKHDSIPIVEEREVYPVSSAQKRLYILHQLEGAALSYNMPDEMVLEGKLDLVRMEAAFKQLIQRHESLRTGFEMIEGEPVQRVYQDVPFAVEYVKATEEEAEEIIQRFVREFNLEQPPLLRVGLIEVAPDRHILMLDTHHMISDGVSSTILMEEFVRLYEGESLPPLRIQYKDYAVWQQSQVQSEQTKQQEAYWLDVFAGDLPVLEMPTDHVRPALQNFSGGSFEFIIPPDISKKLKKLAAQTGSTLYMLLLATYTTLLHKYSGQEDVIVGTPIAGRAHADLEAVIGMFVNTLAIRSYPSGEKTFLHYLNEIKEITLSAYEHQEYPFEELVEKVVVNRDLSRNALFDTMFVLQNIEHTEREITGLQLKPYSQEHQIAKFDLTFVAVESDEEIACNIQYRTSLYEQKTIERMAYHLLQLVTNLVHHPEREIASLEMMSPEEQTELMTVFNNTAVAYPKEKTIQQFFEEQVERNPNAVAVVFEDQAWSYRELNEQANKVAWVLRDHGVQADKVVGIMAERSLEMIVGILGILKAGGAYVPIDPAYPAERIDYILEDSEAIILLIQEHLSKPEGYSNTIFGLNEIMETEKRKMNIESASSPRDLAYVIYTSGSTGKPKGIMIEHQSVSNILVALERKYPVKATDAYLLKTTFTFDVSVTELFGWFVGEGRLVILPPGDEKDPRSILNVVEQKGITHMNFAPSMLHVFLDMLDSSDREKLRQLRYIFVAGEAVSPQIVAKFNALKTGVMLENIYGPTESTIYATSYSVIGTEERIPIGKPLDNIQALIVSKEGQLQPIGVPGELYLGGAGLARGYLNRGDLNETSFVHIIGENKLTEGRWYRTGDLARWLPDGNIEYLGRIDHQVKIRGFRIELGEIEAQLLKVEAMQEAVVIAQDDQTGQKHLCAYFVAEHECNISEVRGALSLELPGYMIPSYFVQLKEMPLTASGKIDRKALPSPEEGLQSGTEYVAPRTETETRLVQMWQEILGIQRIGVKDNFFAIGGHSLRATTLVSRIHKELNIVLPLRIIFQSPTIEALAEEMTGMGHYEHVAIPVITEREYYPVSSAQKRIYILQQVEGAELSYNMPDMMVLEGELDRLKVEGVFRKLIDRHETLRTGFEEVDGEPVQRIYQEIDFSLEFEKAEAEEVEEIMDRFIRAFTLAKPPLLRVGLVELEKHRHLLLLDMHHIISDAASMRILIQEFFQMYEEQLELPPLRIQYKDYAVWQQNEMQNGRMKKQEGYWLEVFSGKLPTLELPTDFERPTVRSFEGDTLEFEFHAS